MVVKIPFPKFIPDSTVVIEHLDGDVTITKPLQQRWSAEVKVWMYKIGTSWYKETELKAWCEDNRVY